MHLGPENFAQAGCIHRLLDGAPDLHYSPGLWRCRLHIFWEFSLPGPECVSDSFFMGLLCSHQAYNKLLVAAWMLLSHKPHSSAQAGLSKRFLYMRRYFLESHPGRQDKCLDLKSARLTVEILRKFMQDPGFNCFLLVLVEWVPPNAHAHFIDRLWGTNRSKSRIDARDCFCQSTLKLETD